MADGTKKAKKYDLVRIWTDEKNDLDELMRDKAKAEKRRVTEVSLASAAIRALVKKERRKLDKIKSA